MSVYKYKAFKSGSKVSRLIIFCTDTTAALKTLNLLQRCCCSIWTIRWSLCPRRTRRANAIR